MKRKTTRHLDLRTRSLQRIPTSRASLGNILKQRHLGSTFMTNLLPQLHLMVSKNPVRLRLPAIVLPKRSDALEHIKVVATHVRKYCHPMGYIALIHFTFQHSAISSPSTRPHTDSTDPAFPPSNTPETTCDINSHNEAIAHQTTTRPY